MESKKNTQTVLEDLFDEMIGTMKIRKDKIISGIIEKQWKGTYETCTSFFIILTYLFFQKIACLDEKNNHKILPENEIVEWILLASVKYTSFVDYKNKKFEQNKIDRIIPFQLCASTQNAKSSRTNSIKKKTSFQFQKLIVESRECYWQAIDDLQAAEVLLDSGFYAQSVNVCQQAIEKSLKSILTIKGKSNAFWQTNHCLIELSNRIQCNNFDIIDMCISLEQLGLTNWKYNKNPKTSTLSIRSRYCDFSQGGVLYLDTLPMVVFDKKMAEKAFQLTKGILDVCKLILYKEWKKYA